MNLFNYESRCAGLFIDQSDGNSVKSFVLDTRNDAPSTSDKVHKILYGTEFYVGSLNGFRNISIVTKESTTDEYLYALNFLTNFGEEEGVVGIIFIDEDIYGSKYICVNKMDNFYGWYTDNGEKVELNDENVILEEYYDEEAEQLREEFWEL